MIAKDEIEKFRSPSEYVQWFESHLETINQDRNDKEGALQHKGFWKLFYEELFPLYRLLKNKLADWNKSHFRNVIGSQSYDVEVKNNNFTYMEIGTSEYDYVQLLHMKKLIADGHVKLPGKTKKDINGRPISIGYDARCRNEIVQERVDSITALITSKSKKIYPDSTGLIVYYDDISVVLNESDNEIIRSRVVALRPKWECTFDVIYLVGPRGDKLIEVKKTAK